MFVPCWEKEMHALDTNVVGATVFRDGARVTRSGSITLDSGPQRVKVTGITKYAENDSFRVKGKGNASIASIDPFGLNERRGWDVSGPAKVPTMSPVATSHSTTSGPAGVSNDFAVSAVRGASASQTRTPLSISPSL